ncbi:hypothetical protein AYR66_07970 [Noviherbaspirillum denitrificans]|uniref:Uncharacterized protein n=2 Tax=Noviherbaspirillum denitrificans TaxID=1968433 RepID=A0A254T9Z3_9BURK|nr:hypothetical protein AYR66_07970 [Noviherbaspirillum denitrificans]
MALSALLIPRSAFTALPPATVGSSTQIEPRPASTAPANGQTAESDEDVSWWTRAGIIAPRYSLYGSVGYEWFRNTGPDFNTTSQGLTSVIGSRFSSYIWEPWFGKFFGDMRLHLGQNSFASGGDMPGSSTSTRNILFSGNGRLSLMYRSRFPFEAYFDRTYSRTTADFSPMAGATVNNRFGFTQSYTHESGASGSLDWNRSTQSSSMDFGGSRMDSLLLTMAHRLPEQTMGASIGTNVVTQQGIDSRSRQLNVSASHNYAPEDEYYTVDTTANINTSGFRLDGATSDVRLTQISSMVTYRPEEVPYTINAAVRALGLTSELNDPFVTRESANRKLQTTNLSLGMTYTLSTETYAYGAVNLNASTSNGERRNTTSETVSITHSPEGTELGDYIYRWSASGGASHATETSGDATGELSLQLSHSLYRNWELESGDRINFSATQALAAAIQSRRRNDQEKAPDLATILTPNGSRRLTHNAGVSWTSSEGASNTMVHAGYSDSRSLMGATEVFQMLTLQFTGNLQTGGDSSWSGSLSMQAVKQDLGNVQIKLASTTADQNDIKLSSNGSVTYRHSRLFGIRRLGFSTSVRMSSNALLPMLGGPSDYETSAWDTRLDYTIGRLVLRANALISRSVMPVVRRTPDGFELSEGEAKLNKSIMFTVTRTFGY